MAHASDGKLDHLTGARCLASLWIVCAHYLPRHAAMPLVNGQTDAGFMNGVLFRDNVAVDFFVLLSGFITHWAYGSMALSSWCDIRQYYVRRLGRTLLTTWFSMVLWCFVELLRGTHPEAGHVARCLVFVEQWRWVPHNWCPSAPSWFVFALLPSWLLYPALRVPVQVLEERGGKAALLALSVALYSVSFGPGLWHFWAQGGNLSWGQSAGMMYYPHVQLPDFLLGVVTAALAQRYVAEWGDHTLQEDSARSCEPAGGASPRWLLGLLGDASLLFTVASLCLVPTPCLPHCKLATFGWEPLANHGFALALSGFILGSVASGGRGVSSRLLRHGALVELGKLSFEVYIFQEPLHNAFRLLGNVESPQVFMAYLLSLLTFSALYASHVQAPLVDFLRSSTTKWARRAPRPSPHDYTDLVASSWWPNGQAVSA